MTEYFVQAHEAETAPLLGSYSQVQLAATTVYPIVQLIREDCIHYVDTALSYDALTSTDMIYSLVRPLQEKYNKLQNMAVPFCLLLNRVNFLRDRNIATRGLSQSRAELCEILAVRTLRHWASSTLDLAVVLTTSWQVFSGADAHVMCKLEENEEDLDATLRVGNAIEMAILGQAKRFISSAVTQKIINGIWSGQIIYQPEGTHSILSDTYKRAPVHFYDPVKAPLLDHYRLKVPAVRSVLEYLNFVALFILFIVVLETNELSHINAFEWIFIVFAIGFTFDRLASMQEHGIKLYSANLWNGFDVAFICTFLPYFALRMYGSQKDVPWAREWSIDILAVAAVFMFPRLAFVSLSNNLMLLSVRSMFTQFFQLMALAIFCFAGFLYALWTFGKSRHSATQIAWWMADLWFGLDATGFEKAAAGDFHPFFGPPLVAVYTCCSSTLLLTVLVSILSHTFSNVVADAAAEAMFRRAVTTIEGVKADALFSYQPPMNIFAFFFMFPISFILNPRWFHKVNVLMIRITSFPILLSIGIYERSRREGPKRIMERVSAVIDLIPRRLRPLTFFEGLSGQTADIDAIFEIEAQVVDEVLDAATRGSIKGNETPPQSPRRAGASPRPAVKKLPSESGHSIQSSPPINVPQALNSPERMINFPGSVSTGSPQRGAPLSARSDTRSDDGHGNGTQELFRESSADSSQGLPQILRTPPPRPQLPPRHVRTRRDSHALQLHRMAALTTSGPSQPVSNPDPFALGPPMGGSAFDANGALQSPLGQLYGTVVTEDESDLGGPGRSFSLAKRLRTMSASAGSALDSAASRHRRQSSNVSLRPTIHDRPSEEFPETVQEAEDDAEEKGAEPLQGSSDRHLLGALKELRERQERMEAQIKQVLEALQRR